MIFRAAVSKLAIVWILCAAGCTFFDDEKQYELLDPDEDGIYWPDDCDDGDSRIDDQGQLWFHDADGDGWGDRDDVTSGGCEPPPGYVPEREGVFDCDDGEPAINPGASEQDPCDENGENCCDYKDNDCNLYTDDGLLCVVSGLHPASDADLALVGSEGERAGWAVAGVGDINDSGYRDIAIGAPMAAGGGLVYIVDGADLRIHVGLHRGEEEALADAAVLAVPGPGPGAYAGYALAGLRDTGVDGVDFNEDTKADLVLGAPQLGDAAQAGVVQVHTGRLDFALEPDLLLAGESPGSRTGAALAAGDFDGQADGDDLLVGVPYGGERCEGKVYFYEDLTLAESSSQEPAVLAGSGTGESAGCALAGAGDPTGDGIPWVLVGATGLGVGGAVPGGAYLLAAPDLTLVADTGIELATVSTVLYGEDEGDDAGAAVCAAGDTNGDGYDDLLVGAPGWSGGAGEGCAYLVAGQVEYSAFEPLNDISILATFRGSQSGEAAGVALASVGDLDGNGYDDILIGAEGGGVGDSSGVGESEQGTVSLFLGPVFGSPDLADEADLVIVGAHKGDKLGHSLAVLGDLDGVAGRTNSTYVLIGASDAAGGNGSVYLFGLGGY